jgi:hypothetical protein
LNRFILIICLIVSVISCELADSAPADSFQIRFANTAGFEGTRFAIGEDADNLACESSALAVDEITGYSCVKAGTYSLFIDQGAGWVPNWTQIPGSVDPELECTFEAGKKYEYGTDGGAFMYVSEK